MILSEIIKSWRTTKLAVGQTTYHSPYVARQMMEQRMNVLFGSEAHSKCGKKQNDLNVRSFLMVSVSAEKLPA